MIPTTVMVLFKLRESILSALRHSAVLGIISHFTPLMDSLSNSPGIILFLPLISAAKTTHSATSSMLSLTTVVNLLQIY